LANMRVIDLNFIDIHFRRGSYSTQLSFIHFIKGGGVIETISEEVMKVKTDDRVAFVHQPSTYSEECLVQADKLILLPKHMPSSKPQIFHYKE